MRIQAFNGGLITRIAENLVGPSNSVKMTNVYTDEVILQSVKKPGNTALAGVQKYAYYSEIHNKWVSDSIESEFAEYNSKVYISSVGKVPRVWDGASTVDLGIRAPFDPPNVVPFSSGVLNATYTYLITFYNPITGVESGPSPVVEVTPALQQVSVYPSTIPADPQVTHFRVYRVGGSLTEFSLVGEHALGGTAFFDNLLDVDIPGDVLTSGDYAQAPFGARYITEAYAMLFAAVDNKVYYTPVGIPWAWPVLNFISFKSTIKGITVISSGILVHMKNETEIITGSSPETLSRYSFDKTQGSKKDSSKTYIGSAAYWISNDGICGTTGGLIKVMSKNHLGFLDLTPVVTVTHNEVAYFLHASGLLAMDLKYEAHFKEYDIANLEYLIAGNDKLYGYINGAYYEMFAGGEAEEFLYKTGKFTDGIYTNRKSYKHLYIRSEGSVKVKVYIDDELVNTWELTETDTHDLDVAQNKKNGYSLQLELSGTGRVYEIDYSVRGRENG